VPFARCRLRVARSIDAATCFNQEHTAPCACSLQSDPGLCFLKNGRFAISFSRTSRRSGLRVWSGRNLQRFHGSCLGHHRNAAGLQGVLPKRAIFSTR